jgi:AcrR family transcriptional regulator
MAPDEPPAEGPETEALSWRDLAVARSLDSARLRAESRVQRFLDAAIELLTTGSGKDFTVQEVVERSGQSLRSFYQYFSGKHELLLALFEESVRATADHLRQAIADEKAPIERLHRFVVEYYRMCRPPADGSAPPWNERPPIMTEFAQQLLTTHPKEAAQAFAPMVALFEELLEGAVQAKGIRADVRQGPIIGVVLEVIMFNAFSSTIGGLSIRPDDLDGAEELWRFVLHGIGTTGS